MTVYGSFLSAEEHPPLALVDQAVRAEQAGFEALWISDHCAQIVKRRDRCIHSVRRIGSDQRTQRTAATCG